MLVMDFINVGNGDAALIREIEDGQQRFAMLVDCGHDRLIREDHAGTPDPRSRRIYAGDFLREKGVENLDLLILTHFHRDHIGGLSRVLDMVTVGELLSTYDPPEDAVPPDPEGVPDLPKAARNLLMCLHMYLAALRDHPGRVQRTTVFPGDRVETRRLTEDLEMEIICGEPALYPRQAAVYDAAYHGQRNEFDLLWWGKSMNISSLRLRLHYHGRDVVLGGDAYAVTWNASTLIPCEILKVPHHASLSSITRKYLKALQPKTAVVSVAAGRPDERPHPYIVSLLGEYAKDVYFTDAVDIPGLVKPQFHQSVRLTLD